MNVPSREAFGWLTAGGLGHFRPFPGTWGSLPPVILAGALITLGAGPQGIPWVYNAALAITALVFSVVCVTQGDRAELAWGKDPSPVVADEVAGQSIVLTLLPLPAHANALQTIAVLGLAFLLFRVLDIVKPWPARQIQRVPGGWGILLDDLVAGLYAWFLIQGFFWL
ncbi:MAG: hypothetical protein AMXMBFR58_37070 [Phycisphaerae bacterium]